VGETELEFITLIKNYCCVDYAIASYGVFEFNVAYQTPKTYIGKKVGE
jgi:hypothetical protein